MRIVGVMLGLPLSLALLLSACGRPAGGAALTSSLQPRATEASQGPVAGPVEPDPRVGAVFLGDGDLHSCTGSVVHSAAGDLVLTAAHCLGGYVHARFVPGFADSAAPADSWMVDAIYLDPRWSAAKDPLADYAIVRISRADGKSVEAQAGSALWLGTAPKPGSQVRVIGYPAGVGGKPIGCQASTGIAEGGYPSLLCAGMDDGTSGAPWISGSTVTGLIGGFEGGGCANNVSYSAPFDERTAQLLARAESGGPGDPAPAAFDVDC